jgi:hypothetical protein
LLVQDRRPIHIGKKRIKPLEMRARQEGCRVIPDSAGCTVPGCPELSDDEQDRSW